jgi:hypothetical protein
MTFVNYQGMKKADREKEIAEIAKTWYYTID